MMKKLKLLTVNMVAGGNVATVAVMLLSAYADRFHPADYPLLPFLGTMFPVFLLFNLLFLLFWVAFYWRRAWIPVAGYALAYGPLTTYMPLNPQHDVPEGCIKLVTYNVCSYGGNYKYEDAFERILDYLEQQQADIVCTQEDVDSWRRYMMDKYRRLYPYNDTTMLIHNAKSYNCVGLHSRFPILRKERISYPSRANGSVAYYLKVGRDTLLVVNNHLENTHLTKEDRSMYEDMLRGTVRRDTAQAESMLIIGKLGESAAARAPQAEAVSRYVSQHSQYPVIVCGDFNDTPVSYTRRTLAKGLTDCYAAAGRGIGLSYNRKGFWVRIDHILCSRHFTPLRCQVDSKIDLSDHYPVLCWLKMSDNNQILNEKRQ